MNSIAERHGGKVWVESVLEQGSTFFLFIPFTQPNGVGGWSGYSSLVYWMDIP